MENSCPCLKCKNFKLSKLKCSRTCKPLENFNNYLEKCKVSSTNLTYNTFTKNPLNLRFRLKYT